MGLRLPAIAAAIVTACLFDCAYAQRTNVAVIIEEIRSRNCGIEFGTAPLSDVQRDCAAEFLEPIEALRTSDPIADASREASGGDFRLISITGAWSGSSSPGITCAIGIPDSMIRAGLFFSDVIYGQGDINFRNLAGDYTDRYNRAIVSDARFPYADLCRQREAGTESDQWQASMPLQEWLTRSNLGAVAGSLNGAARTGNTATLVALLEAGTVPDTFDGWGFSPLMWAALRGDATSILLLVRYGANPDLPSGDGLTPLALAIHAQSPDAVRALTGSGADLELSSAPLRQAASILRPGQDNVIASGRPLAIATVLAQPDIVEHLLDIGASPDVIAPQGLPLSAWSVRLGDLASLRLLLEAGADATAFDRQGISLIQTAAEFGNAEAIQLLLDHGAASSSRSDFEAELWQLSAQLGRDAILVQLVRFGADLNLARMDERAGLNTAIANGSSDTVQDYLDRLDQRRQQLVQAIVRGNLEGVRQIFSAGASLDERYKPTAIQIAAEHGQDGIIQWLLEQGADPGAPIAFGNLDYLRDGYEPARRFGTVPTPERRIYQTLPRQVRSPLTVAFGQASLDTARLLASALPDGFTNRSDLAGSTHGPLREAFRAYRSTGNRDAILLALELGGWPEQSGFEADTLLRSACFWAPSNNSAELLRLFIARGYRPLGPGDDIPPARFPGDSRAAEACIGNGTASARLILEAGADPNQINSIGQTLLIDAVGTAYRADQLETVELLLRLGADPNLEDGYGQRPLDVFAGRTRNPIYQPMTDLLRRYGAQTTDELVEEGHGEPEPEREFVLPIR